MDFYEIDELFTEEERMIRDAVREWVDGRVLPIIGELAYTANLNIDYVGPAPLHREDPVSGQHQWHQSNSGPVFPSAALTAIPR